MAKHSYKLPEQYLPGIAYSDCLSDIKDFKKLVDGLGIRTQNTRIERYLQYLDAIVNEEISKESQIFKGLNNFSFNNPLDRQLYVVREVHELMWIQRGLNVHMPKGVEEKLNTIVSGRDFAAMDVNSSSRNTQFELRIASHFCQDGYHVDLSTETDIIATKSHDVYFVECKRVASDNLFLRRAKEAQKQLKLRLPKNTWNKRYYGLVAVDVTKVAFTHNGLTFGYTAEHTKDIIQDKLKDISNRIDDIRFFTNDKNMLLLWLQIHIPALVRHPPQCTTRFSSFFIINPYLNKKNIRAFKQLQIVLEKGKSADPREIIPEKLDIRKSITFSKGTTVGWDEELLLGFLDTWELEHREPDSTVLKLTFDGEEHDFLYYDFEVLVAGLDETAKKRLQHDAMRARFEFAAELYLRRYPYKQL